MTWISTCRTRWLRPRVRRGVEALLVRSASLLGDNLVIFPDRLAKSSRIEEVRFVDPRLVKRR